MPIDNVTTVTAAAPNVPEGLGGRDRRRLLRAHWANVTRVDTLCLKIMADRERARRTADLVGRRGVPLAPIVLPPLPDFPPECRNMICGGKGRRSGKPCQRRDLYLNGRCKWHGGLSTGPKTPGGRAKSLSNLKRGPKL